MIHLTEEQYSDMVNHAKSDYPKEACGIIAGKVYSEQGQSMKKATRVYKMANASDNPETCYFMKPEEQLKVFKEIRQLEIEMLGIYHSHSQSPAYPSQRDCELAFYPEASYLIISLRHFNSPEARAFKIIEGKIQEENIIVRKNILFICVENSCRSQIAEAIVNNLYWRRLVAHSAGSRPSGVVNSKAQEVMKEIGIDISNQRSKGFDEIRDMKFDYVITLGCDNICSVYPGKHKLNWQIDDPKDKPIEFFRKTRDAIHTKIKELTERILSARE